MLKDDKIVDVLVSKKFHWMGFRATPAHCIFIDLERHVSSWEKMKPRMLASYARSAYPKQIAQNELEAQQQEKQEPQKPSRLPIWAGRLTILGILFALYFYFLVYPHSNQQVSVISRLGKIEAIVYPPQQVWPIPFLDEVTSFDASDILSDPSLSEEQKNDAIIQRIVSK
ncbi:hypothetical protein DBZ36_09980 [Alginatibacterium sediminis]|uniref:Uncharacterized protein n=1 Tax=Alginatibacterium sediminis TaxID=2164068 RepID=A0A420EDA4_9ALTE|nr:hypothetical protein DBZ36_09980 [Alginatibacterium sediminis]